MDMVGELVKITKEELEEIFSKYSMPEEDYNRMCAEEYRGVREIREKWGWLGVFNYQSVREHARRWGFGLWEAVRKIIQNCLDKMQEVYGVPDYKVTKLRDGVVFSDSGRGIGVLNLRGVVSLKLGRGEKPKWARGYFEEGLKIALMTLLNMGFDVDVVSGKYYYKPAYLKFRIQIEPGEYAGKSFSLYATRR